MTIETCTPSGAVRQYSYRCSLMAAIVLEANLNQTNFANHNIFMQILHFSKIAKRYSQIFNSEFWQKNSPVSSGSWSGGTSYLRQHTNNASYPACGASEWYLGYTTLALCLRKGDATAPLINAWSPFIGMILIQHLVI